MEPSLRRPALGIVVWLLFSGLGALWIARAELAQQREAFETDARIAHRLLSQRVLQHEAVMATLALLQPASDGDPPEQRLPSVYPQVLGVQRRDRHAAWPDERLRAAEAESRQLRRAVLAGLDLPRGRYQLVLGADPTSYALQIDMRSMVPWSEWPMKPDTSPTRVTLEHGSQSLVLQPGRGQEGGWRFEFRKHLPASSQPFDLVALRQVGPGDLPWAWMASWAALVAALMTALLSWQRQRAKRRRAEELLRLGQVARLNALGELAAGMAHELNQPLTAVLANSQAASRLLDEDPPELATARGAMTQAVEQARRACDVVGRLRRAVQRPDLSAQVQAVALQEAVRNALYLLEPECQRRHVSPALEALASSLTVLAEPVALEQIIHNLLMNALQALEQVPAAERSLRVALAQADGQGVLTVSDSGPGIPAELLPRIFEPFFSTRSDGLGLGLSLCETLATSMGGTLSAAPQAPRGAQYRLALPLAPAS